ncbi:hypothetical protein [Herbiconiux sp. VKM Ac-2851]|uniref:hypothetical protein n=1 Tax=Herbiconiux sp. VKM Ac-2851 TaxID=2739025 RepID=UPI00156703D0|nr:hypothetical protein [Herbiconiux sp. VKM Ac-2851]NQX34051.1 hypothetical protein [Herbiconiux sp. VKM Ac-2851]
MSTLAENLVGLLKPMLPEKFRYVTSERNIDTLSAPTVIVTLQNIEPAPNIQAGSNLLTFRVTIAVPTSNFDKAEESLEDAVLGLLAAFDDLPAFLWSGANKVRYEDSLAFDITLTVTSRKD